jgi:hypothetical protein
MTKSRDPAPRGSDTGSRGNEISPRNTPSTQRSRPLNRHARRRPARLVAPSRVVIQLASQQAEHPSKDDSAEPRSNSKKHNGGNVLSDYREATDFLEWLRPGGPWVLTAIHPTSGKIETITARDKTEARDFIREHDGKRNLYYSVNPTRTAMTRKAAKTDIAAIEYLLADLDPHDGENPEDAKARYLKALETFEPAATGIIDSGNGIQGLWKLATRIELAEPVGKTLPAETAAIITDVEARSFGGWRYWGSRYCRQSGGNSYQHIRLD